jgi:hypothetical protein
MKFTWSMGKNGFSKACSIIVKCEGVEAVKPWKFPGVIVSHLSGIRDDRGFAGAVGLDSRRPGFHEPFGKLDSLGGGFGNFACGTFFQGQIFGIRRFGRVACARCDCRVHVSSSCERKSFSESSANSGAVTQSGRMWSKSRSI